MTQTDSCSIGQVEISPRKLTLLAGPCLAESREMCLEIAERMARLCEALNVGYVFKASFDKANRTSLASFRTAGMQESLRWFQDVRERIGCPTVTDVHETMQVPAVAQAVDCLQIPAFLCRQTDLLLAAGNSGRAVNIKKGQFMAPWDMGNAVDKVRSTGNANLLLTERGTSFGYNRLVTDFRGLAQMRQFAPVCFDATHSTQEPGGLGGASGGQRQYAPMLASAALAMGAEALFFETHPDPDAAKSDAACQVPLDQMEDVLRTCLRFWQAAHLDKA
jgi:2-dehydro-3-deoxyphosphooctonate aldolase (KDO 8-P synthase)